jgi:glycosyltransferase involved in cell wall biosynthesis
MASVTIGLPVYNGAVYLDKALASLCTQNFQDLKILIADNASTDETGDIIKKWAAQDPRIEYHRHAENIGAVANFEWVLHNTDSRYFCFAAHDDLWSPDFIASLYEAITKNSSLTLAAPRMITMFEDGREDNIFPFDEKIKDSASRLSRIRLSLKKANSGWFYGLFDRMAFISYFKQVSGFKYAWGHDFIIILPAIFANAVTGSDKAVYYKTQTPLSEERYRPQAGKDQCILYQDTLRESFKLLDDSPLSSWEKKLLFPYVIKYARKIQKFKRMLRAVVKDLFKRG